VGLSSLYGAVERRSDLHTKVRHIYCSYATAMLVRDSRTYSTAFKNRVSVFSTKSTTDILLRHRQPHHLLRCISYFAQAQSKVQNAFLFISETSYPEHRPPPIGQFACHRGRKRNLMPRPSPSRCFPHQPPLLCIISLLCMSDRLFVSSRPSTDPEVMTGMS
jgi:hypothetical protein